MRRHESFCTARSSRVIAGLAIALAACSDSPTAPPLGDAAYEIVYVYTTHQSSMAGELYVITPDGSARRRLTPDSLTTSQPAWSPDRRRVIFEVNEYSPTVDQNLGLIDADGSNLHFLDVQHDVHKPEWSPDATRLAVVYSADPFTFGPAIMNADGSDLAPIAVAHKWPMFRPSWSPMADSLLLTRFNADNSRTDVWLVDVAGTTARPFALNARDARWSPNGHHVAFFGVADPGAPGAQPFGVVVMNTDGSARRLVAAMGDSPVWSPDSRRLAFTLRHSDNSRTDIHVVDIAGGAPVNITRHERGQHAHLPDWSPPR